MSKDPNLIKAIDIFENIKEGESISVSDIKFYVFCRFLQKLAKNTVIDGYIKVLSIKKTGTDSALVLFEKQKVFNIRTDKNYRKASLIFRKIKIHQTIAVTDVNVYVFSKYLHRLSRIRGEKTFIIKKTSDNSVSVYCNSTQAL